MLLIFEVILEIYCFFRLLNLLFIYVLVGDFFCCLRINKCCFKGFNIRIRFCVEIINVFLFIRNVN